MSEPQVNHKDNFEIIFPQEQAQTWSTLAYIIFNKKPALAKMLEQEFSVKFEKPASTNPIQTPINKVSFWGYEDSGEKIMKALNVLMEDFQERKYFSKEAVQKIAQQINTKGFVSHEDGTVTEQFQKAANQNNPRGVFEPRTEKQTLQAKLIEENDITFSIGPAGTGKTHVAMAMAVRAFREGKIKKIIVTRPAVSDGEDIGAVPGTKEDKMDDYMRPLYDELEKTFGIGKPKSMLANKTLEIVLIGKMRGRTFENAFIILDEAQNCNLRQIKTALTRLGPGSKMVITGDPQQSDLPEGKSGLQEMIDKLQDIEGIAMQYYDATDVVRHPTVQRIIERLEGKRPAAQAASAPKNP